MSVVCGTVCDLGGEEKVAPSVQLLLDAGCGLPHDVLK